MQDDDGARMTETKPTSDRPQRPPRIKVLLTMAPDVHLAFVRLSRYLSGGGRHTSHLIELALQEYLRKLGYYEYLDSGGTLDELEERFAAPASASSSRLRPVSLGELRRLLRELRERQMEERERRANGVDDREGDSV